MKILTKALLLATLTLGACGLPESCEDTCCGSSPGDAGTTSAMEPGACASGRTYQTCGSLGSTVIDLHVPGQQPCSFDTIDVRSTGAVACLKLRDTFCAQ